MEQINNMRVNITELTTVRILCSKCKSVSEIPIERLTSTFEHNLNCRHCNQKFPEGASENYFMKLADAFNKISDITEFDFEFCIPVNKKTEK